MQGDPMVELKIPVRLLALGDSYTIGEAVSVRERWPNLLVGSLRAEGVTAEDPRIIAVIGWRTDQLKQAIVDARLEKDEFNLVTLLIGVNNQYQGRSADSYEHEFRDLLQNAIVLAGISNRVIVLSIPDYGYTPFGKEKRETISRQIDEFNSVNRRVTQELGATYISITDISREGLRHPELVTLDGLHPSGAMYGEWVSRILARLKWPAR